MARGCFYLYPLSLAASLLLGASLHAIVAESSQFDVTVENDVVSLPGLQVLIKDAVTGETCAITDLPNSFPFGPSQPLYLTERRDLPQQDMSILLLFSLHDGGLRCDATVSTARRDLRQVSISFSVPWAPSGRLMWAQHDACPLRLGPEDVAFHRGQDDGFSVILPAVAIYDGGRGGSALVAPFEGRYPMLQFRKHGERLDMVTTNLQLHRLRPAHSAALFVPLPGDWRTMLAWLVDFYPDYFICKSPVVAEHDGWMVLGPYQDEATLDYFKELGVRWIEADLLSMNRDGQIYVPPDVTAEQVEAVRTYVRNARARGISIHQYFQTVELRANQSETWFPEDRFKQPDLTVPPEGWMGAYNWHLPETGSAWQAHITRQLRRVLDLVPGVQGVYVDVNIHSGFVYGRDDGISAARGERGLWGDPTQGEGPVQPVYQFAFANADALDHLRVFLAAQGLGMRGTGSDMATLHYCDGWLLETLRFYRDRYLCVRQPMNCILYFDTNDPDRFKTLDSQWQLVLLGGMQPGFNAGEVKAMDGPVMHGYQPLFRQLVGRRWVLSSDPLTVIGKSVKGEVFETPRGYAVVLISPERSFFNGPESARPVTVLLRVLGVEEYDHAWVRSVQGHVWEKVKTSMTPRGLRLVIRGHISTTMVILGEPPR